MTDQPERMTTWQMEDGTFVWGEFGFVTETEFFEDTTDPSRLIRKTWVAESVDAGTFYPTGSYLPCPDCEGEGHGGCLTCGDEALVLAPDGWDPDSPHDARTEHPMTDPELQALAEAATPGPWVAVFDCGGWCDCPPNGCDYRRLNDVVTLAQEHQKHTSTAVYAPESKDPYRHNGSNARFIAAANPTTVLALLARLARADAIETAARDFLNLALCNAPDVPVPWSDPAVTGLVSALTAGEAS